MTTPNCTHLVNCTVIYTHTFRGSLIKVWWSGEKSFFSGVVQKVDGSKFDIEYEDGDSGNRMDFKKERWLWSDGKGGHETPDNGDEIMVFWMQEEEFFRGVVVAVDGGKVDVEYEDGDVEKGLDFDSGREMWRKI